MIYFFIILPIVLIISILYLKSVISKRKFYTALKVLAESSGKLTIYDKINEQ